ncbi:MAG: hypothetical protein JWQ18_3203 [Conexibacter sp.]|nr:hypothetical protein [Conexibacter sp.]
MRCRAALAVSLALAFGACTKDAPPLPDACLDTDRAGYEHALASAPGAVALPGGTLISTCLQRVRTDAELQNIGAVVHAVAEDYATRARESSDPQAALRLGFLSAAVSRGAGHSNGIASELARRVETAGIGLRDGSSAVAGALDRGLAAGAARG